MIINNSFILLSENNNGVSSFYIFGASSFSVFSL